MCHKIHLSYTGLFQQNFPSICYRSHQDVCMCIDLFTGLFCRLCITFLAFDVIFVIICVAVASLIGIAICCCLPCIIGILYAMTDRVIHFCHIFLTVHGVLFFFPPHFQRVCACMDICETKLILQLLFRHKLIQVTTDNILDSK